MSFLKQLLTPFVEFDEEAKRRKKPQRITCPAAQPAAAPGQRHRCASLLHHRQTKMHITRLIDGGSNKCAMPRNSPIQLPTYSPSGTIDKPLPEHQQYFEKLMDDANRTNPFFREQIIKNL